MGDEKLGFLDRILNRIQLKSNYQNLDSIEEEDRPYALHNIADLENKRGNYVKAVEIEDQAVYEARKLGKTKLSEAYRSFANKYKKLAGKDEDDSSESGGLEKTTSNVISVVGIFSVGVSFFFLADNITGNAVSNSATKSNIIGVILFMFGVGLLLLGINKR
jgi:hypothetical protein